MKGKRAKNHKTTKCAQRATRVKITRVKQRVRAAKITKRNQPKGEENMNAVNVNNMRAAVRGTYDLQMLRIQMGNRVCANFKAKLGQAAGQKEEDMEADAKRILDAVRASYEHMTDGAVNALRKKSFQGDGVIDTKTEFALIANYIGIEQLEHDGFLHLGTLLKECPIYTGFLLGVRGVGPAMAAVLISEIDITKAAYPSSLWKLAGLDVAADGKGRSRRPEHLVSREYETRDGEIKERVGITFNRFLKTKLMGVLAASFLRAGDGPYSKAYNEYKHRLENHAVYGIANDAARVEEMKENTGKKYSPKLHRHNMAMRYMVKRFLVDLYKAWRTMEGLEVASEYAEGKLRHVHHAMET